MANCKSKNGFCRQDFQHEYDHLDGIVFLVESTQDIITEQEYQSALSTMRYEYRWIIQSHFLRWVAIASSSSAVVNGLGITVCAGVALAKDIWVVWAVRKMKGIVAVIGLDVAL